MELLDIPPIVLRRVDPSCNMARFYILTSARTLWGDFAVCRTFGRIGTKGRVHLDVFETRGEAEVFKMRLASAKLRKGYQPSSSGVPSATPHVYSLACCDHEILDL